MALTIATTANEHLQHKLKTTLIKGSLYEITELFIKIAHFRALKIMPTLYKRFFNTTSNLLSIHKNVRNNRKRYNCGII